MSLSGRTNTLSLFITDRPVGSRTERLTQFKDGSRNMLFDLIPRHLQRFWGASGDFWQDLWTKLYVAYEGHDQALFYLGKVMLFTLTWVCVLRLWNGSLFHIVWMGSWSAGFVQCGYNHSINHINEIMQDVILGAIKAPHKVQQDFIFIVLRNLYGE